jgi:UDPglucose 6-dehydrogenase
MIKSFVAEGCSIVAYDPAAIANSRPIFAGQDVKFADKEYDVADGADALIILTDWQEFTQLDYEEMKRRLKYPILLDGRNLLDPKRMASLGITYLCVGRPAYAAQASVPATDKAVL